VLGIGRDPHGLRRVSRATGVHIIAGTGLYVESAHPDWVRDTSEQELADLFIHDLTVGFDDTGIRAGIIGEIGTSGVAKGAAKTAKNGHVTPEEEKVLRAAARASLATGAAVTIHTDRRAHGALHIVDVVEGVGLSPGRLI